MLMSKPDVLIVGAGLAGLCCARTLQRHGVSFEILESSDGVGGRVRTDRLDGFLLDRGYQVLLTAYPEALDQLNYEELRLRPFISGALVRHHGRFVRLTDPSREPGAFFNNVFAPIGSLSDKYRLWKMRNDLTRKPIAEIFSGEETSTLQALRRRGFSSRMIENFLKPLLGGILLDAKLTASSRMFEFAFKMLSEGDCALPEEGMGAIPEQLARNLPEGSIRLQTKVKSIGQGEVVLDSGEALQAKSVVVATDGPEASHLLGYSHNINSRSVSVLYFVAKEPPLDEPILVINGGSRGPVNSVCVPNLVQPSYAPEGDWLVSATVIGWPTSDDKILVNMVRSQLRRWYGLVALEWRLLRTYRILHAHPVTYPMEWQQPQHVAEGLYVCGDHRATPSIQGAMESGRLAAEALLRELGVPVETGEPRVLVASGKAGKHDHRKDNTKEHDDDD
jgi:phytoene dehydrogenase-like protein